MSFHFRRREEEEEESIQESGIRSFHFRFQYTVYRRIRIQGDRILGESLESISTAPYACTVHGALKTVTA